MSKMKSVRPKNTTQLAGFFSVDAGLCYIGDPCYWHPDERDPNSQSALEKTIGNKHWSTFCKTLDKKGFYERGTASFEGLGIVVATGVGDGTYPVFVTYDEYGNVAKVTIEFLIDEAEEEDTDA